MLIEFCNFAVKFSVYFLTFCFEFYNHDILKTNEEWGERQWRRTQLSELRRGREVDIQTDGKWEEKAPGTK